MTFNEQPLCEGLLSRDHKAKLEMSLDYLAKFLNTPGDWGA